MFNFYYRSVKVVIIILLLLPLITGRVMAQKYFTKNGTITFFSKTNIENISADNNQVVSVLNTQTGELQFSLLIKNFHFKKTLMEEHFNENYLESDQFPKAVFKGNLADVGKVNFVSDGSYNVTAAGELTIHGVTKHISTTGTITLKSGKIAATSKFMIKPADFKIDIPTLVKENISESIEVTVSCNYDQKM